MRRIKAFILGMREFRMSFTTHCSDMDEDYAYNLGREWAHRLTLRRYEDYWP